MARWQLAMAVPFEPPRYPPNTGTLSLGNAASPFEIRCVRHSLAAVAEEDQWHGRLSQDDLETATRWRCTCRLRNHGMGRHDQGQECCPDGFSSTENPVRTDAAFMIRRTDWPGADRQAHTGARDTLSRPAHWSETCGLITRRQPMSPHKAIRRDCRFPVNHRKS